MEPRFVVATGLLALLASRCGGAPARTPPIEVPIEEYKADEPSNEPVPENEEPTPGASSLGDSSGEGAKDGATAAKLDAKNGLGGVQLGASVKSVRGIKLSDKSGDRASYRVLKPPSFAGNPLKDVVYTFMKGRLASMSFAAKSSGDCKAVREAFEGEFGPAQKTATTPFEAYVWKGEKVGLRFVVAAGGCGGTVLSRELSDPSSWTSLEP